MKTETLAKEAELKWKARIAEKEKVGKEASKRDAKLEKEQLTSVSIHDVELVIAPLDNIYPSIIKNKGELSLTFAFMYDGITFSHPPSIKSTPKNEDKTFEKDKNKIIEWIKTIKDRDSGIEIHTVIPGTKPSDGITKSDSCNNHLPGDGWNSGYDILIDNLYNLELPPKHKTFYQKRNSWKNTFEAYGMGEKKRKKLVDAIIQYRVKVQKDLNSIDNHDKRMKSIDLWIKSISKSIKSLAQKLYYF